MTRWTVSMMLLVCLHAAQLVVPEAAPGRDRAAKSREARGAQEHHAVRTIPFAMNGGHIVIEVDVAGHPLRLTLDNGNVRAPTILYGSPKIDALALAYDGRAAVGGAGDGSPAGARVASSVTLGLAGVELPGQSVVVMDYDPMVLKAFEGEDGVIGGAVWENFVVQIDFERHVLLLADPDRFSYEGPGRELALGYLRDGGSTLPGSVVLATGVEVRGLFHLDLGSAVALSVNTETHPDLERPEKTIERRAFGSQGAFTEHLGRIGRLRVGGFELHDVLTGFVDTPSLSAMGNQGAIGNPVFQRFFVTFDYRNDRIFLEPNARFDDRFEFDMSGLGLRRTEEGDYEIARVLADSPAADVGLEVGDRIVTIDGRPSREVARHQLTPLLREEGRVVRLSTIRGGEQRWVSLILRRLI